MPTPPPDALDGADVAAVLAHGHLTIQGRLAGSSNGTLLCTSEWDRTAIACVYKPVAGERPLWDFPDATLGHREVAVLDGGKAAWVAAGGALESLAPSQQPAVQRNRHPPCP